jgi:hypothetical protein
VLASVIFVSSAVAVLDPNASAQFSSSWYIMKDAGFYAVGMATITMRRRHGYTQLGLLLGGDCDIHTHDLDLN